MFKNLGNGKYRFVETVRVSGVKTPRKRVFEEPCTSDKKAKEIEAVLKVRFKEELKSSLKSEIRTIDDSVAAYCSGTPGVIEGWGADRFQVVRDWAGFIKLDDTSMIEFGKAVVRYQSSTTKHGKPPSDSNVNKLIGIVKTSTRYCYINNLIDRDWLVGFKKVPENNERAVYVFPETMEAILACLPETWYWITLCAYLTGMRQGELRSLKVRLSSADSRENYIDLSANRFKLWCTKIKRYREVPIPAEMIPYLHKCNGDYVFECRGRQVQKRSLIQAIKRAVVDAKCSDVKFHDLRGSFGTDLYENGESPKVIMEIMGHYSQKSFVRYQKVKYTGKLDEALQRRSESLKKQLHFSDVSVDQKKVA